MASRQTDRGAFACCDAMFYEKFDGGVVAESTVAFPGIAIVGELGRGTTGVVYDARDTRLNRRIALKVPTLTPNSEGAIWARFFREARALARLTSGMAIGIPALHMAAERQGQPYFSRELVVGDTLENHAISLTIDLGQALMIIAEVARIVQWVHEQGFVHRNLCAANVLVAADGSPRLIGFGRVGLLADSREVSADACGTLADVDVRGLREMLGWVCGAFRQPLPPDLERATAEDAAPTAGAFSKVLLSYP